jgi:hypothetical protein
VGSLHLGRAAPFAAVALGVVTLGLDMSTVPLDSLTHQAGTGGPLADTLVATVAVVPATVVGTLLAARRPRNPIGWLILVVEIIGFSPTSEYLVLDYRLHHGTLPLGGPVVVVQEFWPLLLFCIALLLWIFPDGTLPRGRWRRPAWVLVAAGLLASLVASTSGVLAVAEHDVRIKADGDLANSAPAAFDVLFVIVIVASVVSWVSWLVIQIPNYRHADGERRQQLKWLYSGATVFVASLIIGTFVSPLLLREAPGWGTQPVVNAVTNLASAALPVSIGVAVLKYRLYELNRVISRVVAYTLITALLAGVFAGLVLLATRVLPIKGSAAVAVATLVIAALFNPLRRRVQRMVDRRFNRSRYDAEAVVAAFTARLQHTVDLDTLRHDLLGVTESAFQPAHVSVWLAPGQADEDRMSWPRSSPMPPRRAPGAGSGSLPGLPAGARVAASWTSRTGTSASSPAVMNACLSVWGVTALPIRCGGRRCGPSARRRAAPCK